MSDTLELDRFADLIDAAFMLEDDVLPATTFVLIEAKRIGRTTPDAAFRTPFSLIFRVASQEVLPQRIYRLRHTGLGVHDIFLVPIGRDARGTTYQAVFN